MVTAADREAEVARKFELLSPYLDERQQRLWMGTEAREGGHGGVSLVARAAGVARSTVTRGLFELEGGEDLAGRARRTGGGRKRAGVADPGLAGALRALVEPDARGDPGSPLQWTTKLVRTLADELTAAGHKVSPPTVARLLKDEGFSLQANLKVLEGRQHPDRDAQFRYINGQAAAYQASGDPVISVDAKKKELVGQYKKAGRTWRPKGQPEKVNVHRQMRELEKSGTLQRHTFHGEWNYTLIPGSQLRVLFFNGRLPGGRDCRRRLPFSTAALAVGSCDAIDAGSSAPRDGGRVQGGASRRRRALVGCGYACWPACALRSLVTNVWSRFQAMVAFCCTSGRNSQ